ncbi:phosphocholine-specific phospholipase C [Pedobacter nototheniae]|uniref:phosphocholine-specific phospholipase C n=1 Tax=Pedobacter nototheniae TaxID=2488994 RepID=UPI00292CF07E|nr:phospholipase C, phosphocholine-specific [Pedobacter nototheniae]
MDTRREFLRKSLLLSGAAGVATVMPSSIQKALAINPAPGSTFLDAEHVVILMQENRSFDHTFGTLQGVRGFNDPRAIDLPNKKPVWFQTDAVGNTYAPFRLNIKDTKVTWMGSLPHSRASQVDAYNQGKYDQWLSAKQSGNKNYAHMPLTLGHYTREDLPFNYALADAFTVCDQNFCSAMTSTTPNRSFFWTGKITHEENGIPKANIRNDDFAYAKHPWKTFPELLEENKVNWKFYQNETSCGGGFKGEERAWLSNFGCNLLEFFKAYNVKFKDKYVENLQKQVETLPAEINKLQEASPSSDAASKKIQKDLKNKLKALDDATAELEIWSEKNFNKLSDQEKNLFYHAFVVNKNDPGYRSIASLKYNDGGKEREVTVPQGDVLHQFRADVNNGTLRTVSWLAGPQNFSDHPSAPWYGAWYISEVMDVLTKNPEVWKKTIFIVTYDENDGYYDHVPPFSIPDNNKPETGKVSDGIETEIEHVRLVNELKQGVPEKQAREAPIGLGFRVPMLIASPWSRGGKVCSQVFDHTSTLQFLEEFVNKKYNKKLRLENISQWRRAISGNLTSAFAPFDAKSEKLPFLKRNAFVETIYNAQFKAEPTGFKQIKEADLKNANKGLYGSLMSQQEKGVRKSCALPYQLLAGGLLSDDKQSFQINMAARNQIFNNQAAGSPFTVYAPGKFKAENQSEEICRNWSFAVKANDELQYAWPLNAFEGGQYHLRLNGPNGFYREFSGTANDPLLSIIAETEINRLTKIPTGNIKLTVKNEGSNALSIQLNDLAYKSNNLQKIIKSKTEEVIVLNLQPSFGWYDFEIKTTASSLFMQRFAGKVETGKESFTDPAMGRV